MLLVSWDSVPAVDTRVSSTPRSEGVAELLQHPSKRNKIQFLLCNTGEWEEKGLFPAQIAFICEEAAARKVSYQGVLLPKFCPILLHLT